MTGAKKRLAALELATEKAREARKAARKAQEDRVNARLSHDDRVALTEMMDAPDDLVKAVNEASQPYFIPDNEWTQLLYAWMQDEGAEDEPLPPAPAGAAAQFDFWAEGCKMLPDNADEMLKLAARWNGAAWRWHAILAREAGETDLPHR